MLISALATTEKYSVQLHCGTFYCISSLIALNVGENVYGAWKRFCTKDSTVTYFFLKCNTQENVVEFIIEREYIKITNAFMYYRLLSKLKA